MRRAIGGAHFAGLGRGYWGGYRGHWGGWRGYGWRGYGWGLGSALAVGYYGGYYGPYAYDYGYYGPYAYDYSYGAYAYAPDCYIQRHWVINRYGHRGLRRTRVCY